MLLCFYGNQRSEDNSSPTIRCWRNFWCFPGCLCRSIPDPAVFTGERVVVSSNSKQGCYRFRGTRISLTCPSPEQNMALTTTFDWKNRHGKYCTNLLPSKVKCSFPLCKGVIKIPFFFLGGDQTMQICDNFERFPLFFVHCLGWVCTKNDPKTHRLTQLVTSFHDQLSPPFCGHLGSKTCRPKILASNLATQDSVMIWMFFYWCFFVHVFVTLGVGSF